RVDLVTGVQTCALPILAATVDAVLFVELRRGRSRGERYACPHQRREGEGVQSELLHPSSFRTTTRRLAFGANRGLIRHSSRLERNLDWPDGQARRHLRLHRLRLFRRPLVREVPRM